VKHSSIKDPEEHKDQYIHTLGIGKAFLTMVTKAEIIKEKVKIQHFCVAKTPLNEVNKLGKMLAIII
jgi:hypothetical protein